jgi:hypothetical protein
MKNQVDKMSNRCNGKLKKCPVDENELHQKIRKRKNGKKWSKIVPPLQFDVTDKMSQ